MTMHFASVENSDRLRRVLEVLADGQPRSTRDIMKGANVCAVNSCVAELRENGYRIECKQHGHERFVYRLVKQGQQVFEFAGAMK